VKNLTELLHIKDVAAILGLPINTPIAAERRFDGGVVIRGPHRTLALSAAEARLIKAAAASYCPEYIQ
jgi:hypothetical protein